MKVLNRSMSATGGVILLSSSPPTVFARSPTPADDTASSPALPSPGSIFASQKWKGALNEPRPPLSETSLLDGRRRFKTLNTRRDDFGSDFSGSRTLLQEKRSQENVPISNRLTLSGSSGKIESKKQKEERAISLASSQSLARDKDSHTTRTILDACDTPPRHGKAQSSTAKACGSHALSPLRLDKASSRRLDWTPPTCRTIHTSPKTSTQSFSESLLGSFSYNGATFGEQDNRSLKAAEQGMATKRRKLDIVQVGPPAPKSAMAAPSLPPKRTISVINPSCQRSKSPKKKYTTITGLATSHYSGEGANEVSPMMQYLSATQQRALDDDSESLPDTAKRKRTTKRSKSAKKVPRKSALLSPQSALKSFEQQDMLFGFASQLARDESPTLIRDTIQAIKHSQKISLMSDPAPTQNTIPTSEAAETPNRCDKRNVGRFKRTRNLWSAAGRDEDNALLQVDTVDMFDSPEIRAAFAGKDVLLEPGIPRMRASLSPEKQFSAQQNPTRKPFSSMRRPSAATIFDDHSKLQTSEMVVDIDQLEIRTPSVTMASISPLQVRDIHTAAAPRMLTGEDSVSSRDAQPSAQPPPGPVPARPSFQGFTTSQLASQLTAYGFKPVKRREKMIEILDRCWDHKHNTNIASSDAANHSLDKTVERSHSDFLTTVHDISARPIPKIKKPKGRTKKEGTAPPEKSTTKKRASKKSAGEKAPTKMEEPPEKKKAKGSAQPRVSRAKNAGTMSSTSSRSKITSKVRNKAKKAPLSEEYVVDVDEIGHEHAEEYVMDVDDIADDHEFDDDSQNVHSDNTGVKPARSCRRQSLTPMPPSSDGFERASWFEERPSPISTIMKDAKKRTTTTAKSTDSKGLNTRPPPSTIAVPTTIPATTLPRATLDLPTTSVMFTPPPSAHADLPPLSSQISLAIACFRPHPNHNPQLSPTFHEKILMYDPIILEDLAAWLNTEGFRAIGEDREVGPIEVRDWCESEGICCLWRGGWRGNNTKGVRGQGRGKDIKGKEVEGGLNE